MVRSDDQQEVLGHLLRDRRGADHPFALAEILEVLDDRPGEADDVDAGMVVEILVLGRKERRLDAIGHGLDRQIETPLTRELAHQRSVGSMDARRHRRLVPGQHLIVRKVLGEVADIDADRSSDEQSKRRDDAEEIADETYHARSSSEIGQAAPVAAAPPAAKQSRSFMGNSCRADMGKIRRRKSARSNAAN